MIETAAVLRRYALTLLAARRSERRLGLPIRHEAHVRGALAADGGDIPGGRFFQEFPPLLVRGVIFVDAAADQQISMTATSSEEPEHRLRDLELHVSGYRH